MDTNVTTGAPIPDMLSNSTLCVVDKDEFVTAMKAIIMVASSLSILGALMIILVSYCKQEKNGNTRAATALVTRHALRGENSETSSLNFNGPNETEYTVNNMSATDTRFGGKRGLVQNPARIILVCISAADIIVAVSHIWGVSNNYANLQQTSLRYTHRHLNISAENTECGAQAALAIFGAISSFLWSDVLAFMAVVILRSSRWLRPRYFISNRAFVVYNLICWGIPLVVVCVAGGLNAIGFEEGIDVGKSLII